MRAGDVGPLSASIQIGGARKQAGALPALTLLTVSKSPLKFEHASTTMAANSLRCATPAAVAGQEQLHMWPAPMAINALHLRGKGLVGTEAASFASVRANRFKKHVARDGRAHMCTAWTCLQVWPVIACMPVSLSLQPAGGGGGACAVGQVACNPISPYFAVYTTLEP